MHHERDSYFISRVSPVRHSLFSFTPIVARIVGMAGVGSSLLLVGLCCLSTFLTGLSLSAIATNGAMKGGGPYYLIGRSLGPEVGVSIGLCFFLGNAIAGSLYILGAVETLLSAIPGMALFPENKTVITLAPPVGVAAVSPLGYSPPPPVVYEVSPSTHDFQVYGIIFTIAVCLVVLGGVRLVARLGGAFFVSSVVAIISIFVGLLTVPRGSMSTTYPGITGLSTTNLAANWGTGEGRKPLTPATQYCTACCPASFLFAASEHRMR